MSSCVSFPRHTCESCGTVWISHSKEFIFSSSLVNILGLVIGLNDWNDDDDGDDNNDDTGTAEGDDGDDDLSCCGRGTVEDDDGDDNDDNDDDDNCDTIIVDDVSIVAFDGDGVEDCGNADDTEG